MKEGDLVLFYHSNEGKEVVGVAKVVKEFYQDPTTDDERWVVVDLAPVETLKKSVTLETIKADEQLQDIALVRQGRLSVMPLKPEEFDRILALGNA
jgi:predicted RNA-binding protein with PUA-like domain